MSVNKTEAVLAAEVHQSQLEWIQVKQDLTEQYGETAQEKFYRKVGANPFIPIDSLLETSVIKDLKFTYNTTDGVFPYNIIDVSNETFFDRSVSCCLATVGALGYGLWSFRQGRARMSQKMMRLRIVAQGLTVVAIGVGVVVANVSTAKST